MFEISGEISTSNISWIRSVTVFTECWTFSVLQLRLLPVSEDTGNILTKLFYIIKLLKLLIDKDKLFKLNYFNCLSCSALLDPKINILSTTHKYPSRSDLIYKATHWKNAGAADEPSGNGRNWYLPMVSLLYTFLSSQFALFRRIRRSCNILQ